MQTTFKLNEANIVEGQMVFLVGNIPQLGNWDVDKSKVLQNFRRNWPKSVQTSPFTIDHPTQETSILEYKFIICKVDFRNQKQSVTWESGENRRINISKY